MSAPNILWQPNSEPQKAFLRSTARHCLLGGGNFSGKTSALLAASAMSSGHPKSRAIIFRKDYPSLKQIIADSHALFVPTRATYHRSDHIWTWPSGATLEFSHLEDESAVYQHSGKNYNFLGFDEVTHLSGDVQDSRGNPINSAFAFLQTRLRAPKDSALALECRATGTPSGPGMAWVKSFYGIPQSGESSEFVHPLTGYRHQYIRALATENPAIDAEEYARQLALLSPAQRRALQFGDWTSFEGQVFEEWDYAKHTSEPFDVPRSWEVWRGLDDGMASPACCVWGAFDPVRDIVFITDEIYARGLLAEQLALAIREIDKRYGGGLDGVADSSMWADLGVGSEAGRGSRGDVLNRYGLNFKPCAKDRNSRVAGVSQLHQRLAINKITGLPGIVIFRRCRNLIREIPALVYSRQRPEDVDTDCSDHGYDALRYLLGRRKVSGGRVRVHF
jgi:hypothetical protein